MSRIFILYRRGDSGGAVEFIYHQLRARFGRDNVFLEDLDSIPYGIEFRHHLEELARFDVWLILIGERWPQTHHLDDLVRRVCDESLFDTKTVLERGIRVIPVFLGHATMPRYEGLPESLKPLTHLVGAKISLGADFYRDVARLVDDMGHFRLESRNSPAAPAAMGDVVPRSESPVMEELEERDVPSRRARRRVGRARKRSSIPNPLGAVVGAVRDVVEGGIALVVGNGISLVLSAARLGGRLFAGSQEGKEDANRSLEQTTTGVQAPVVVASASGPPRRRQPCEQESHQLAKDPVDCTVFAPPRTARDQTVMVQVFAHLAQQAETAQQLAQQFDDKAEKRGFTSLEMDIARGTKLTFHLVMLGLRIDEPIQTLVWKGEPTSVAFAVKVPKKQKLGNIVGTVSVSQDSIPLGHIKFQLTIDSNQDPSPAGPSGKGYRYRKAFISYATPDRAEVLKRVQMLRQVNIDYFQDLLSLEPGDRWKKKLYVHIDDSDLFLLFWSKAARKSKWVMKEVQYALKRKGSDEWASPEIKPVVIEGPPPPAPPSKLAHLHFNDYFMYFITQETIKPT